ncbi:MAG: 4-oxalocrotonate tautomerase [Gammaproteobacteria bacterium]|jgi:4-oxalocrotonate tautomerase|nr:2-hydroxymuconate tautomerase family protein [Colwellia sp.]PCI56527.1 MAG: 4-oxalocrotonate tautomerase [Gammaproteobacteria bacterium]PHR82745.1 MAG: 4-oxalocrotonate tautomerase [Colwellia sp.]|tara:strand:- start:19536 stop:19733 length:198 start_codon:yes stop_codon:yes gene_type:complete
MPLIQVTIIEGRTLEQKNSFFEKVTAVAVETLNVKEAQVRVVINEVPATHWAIGGVSKANIDANK